MNVNFLADEVSFFVVGFELNKEVEIRLFDLDRGLIVEVSEVI